VNVGEVDRQRLDEGPDAATGRGGERCGAGDVELVATVSKAKSARSSAARSTTSPLNRSVSGSGFAPRWR